MQNNYKTTMCDNISKNGTCKYGKFCKFAHSTDELKQQDQQNYKTIMCRHFQEKGFCNFGDKCSFAHGKQELKNSTFVEQRRPYEKRNQLCRNFEQTGYCSFGDKCSFLHNKVAQNGVAKNKVTQIKVVTRKASIPEQNPFSALDGEDSDDEIEIILNVPKSQASAEKDLDKDFPQLKPTIVKQPGPTFSKPWSTIVKTTPAPIEEQSIVPVPIIEHKEFTTFEQWMETPKVKTSWADEMDEMDGICGF